MATVKIAIISGCPLEPDSADLLHRYLRLLAWRISGQKALETVVIDSFEEAYPIIKREKPVAVGIVMNYRQTAAVSRLETKIAADDELAGLAVMTYFEEELEFDRHRKGVDFLVRDMLAKKLPPELAEKYLRDDEPDGVVIDMDERRHGSKNRMN